MTLQEFRRLSYTEQDEEVFDHGIFLTTYNREDLMYDVYKLHYFFVQYSYVLSENELPEIRALSGTEELHWVENHLFQLIGIA